MSHKVFFGGATSEYEPHANETKKSMFNYVSAMSRKRVSWWSASKYDPHANETKKNMFNYVSAMSH